MNHDVKSHSISRENEIRGFAGNGLNSREAYSSTEINRLAEELNQRITQEMNDIMCSVSTQIRRTINEAISEQVLPQIQATLRSGQGHIPGRRWEASARRPECRSEEILNRNFRSSSRDELPRDFNRNEDLENAHYSITKKSGNFNSYFNSTRTIRHPG